VTQSFTGKAITKINAVVIKDISIFKGKKVILREDILREKIIKMDLFLFWGGVVVSLSSPFFSVPVI